MKQLIIFAATATLALTASSQSIYYQDHDNRDMARHTLRNESMRHEFVIPKVDGYTVLKADLHCHTVYSDASTTPEYRVLEAWTDGLDVLAITDHVEYRRWEPTMLKFLKGYLPADTKAVNHNVIDKAADNTGILADLNVPYLAAQKEAENYGITIIPGAEITRSPETIGHYNALFVDDANTIYDADPAQSMRNARAQGALIMHNHPGWRRKSLEMTEFEKQVYAEHLIDGVEIMNGSEFYPTVVKRAKENGFFMAANTDIHRTTAVDYGMQGHQRNMTLILATDNSPVAIKDALKARRTLAYSFGTIAGDEALVEALFRACVKFEVFKVDNKGRRHVRMVNNSSLHFILNFGGNPQRLNPFSSRNITSQPDGTISVTVDNLFVPTEAQHPTYTIKL